MLIVFFNNIAYFDELKELTLLTEFLCYDKDYLLICFFFIQNGFTLNQSSFRSLCFAPFNHYISSLQIRSPSGHDCLVSSHKDEIVPSC